MLVERVVVLKNRLLALADDTACDIVGLEEDAARRLIQTKVEAMLREYAREKPIESERHGPGFSH
jgi:hypothetical protein